MLKLVLIPNRYYGRHNNRGFYIPVCNRREYEQCTRTDKGEHRQNMWKRNLGYRVDKRVNRCLVSHTSKHVDPCSKHAHHALSWRRTMASLVQFVCSLRLMRYDCGYICPRGNHAPLSKTKWMLLLFDLGCGFNTKFQVRWCSGNLTAVSWQMSKLLRSIGQERASQENDDGNSNHTHTDVNTMITKITTTDNNMPASHQQTI